MTWLGHSGVKWAMAILNLAVLGLVLLPIPDWPTRLVFVTLVAVYVVWSWLTQEASFGRLNEVRPLTRHDLPDFTSFRQRLSDACMDAGLRREPVWAVTDDDLPNAMAVGGTRGIVVLTTALLKNFTAEEILAVVGHELQHLVSRDSLPSVVGSAWLRLFGQISYWLKQLADRSPVALIPAVCLLAATGLDLMLWLISLLARLFLAKRSRHSEHMADLAGARLTSAGVMIAALQRLQTLGPTGRKYPAWSSAWIAQSLYASHPPVERRIEALRGAVERGEVVA